MSSRGRHAPVTAAHQNDSGKDKLAAVKKALQHLSIFFRVLVVLWECLVALAVNFAPARLFKHKKVAGKTILITGGANGLGRKIADALAEKGANLILWDRDEKGLAEAKAEITRKTGVKVTTRTVDMLKREEIAGAALADREESGFVDMLINNAGIGIGGRVLDVAEDAIRKTMEINAVSHFWMAKEFLPAMYERNEGHVVTIASMGGLFAGDQNMVPYCVSKFAAVGLNEGLENESVCLGKDGVRFTTVCPTHFQTPLYDALKTDADKKVMTVDEVVKQAIDGILREMRMVIVPGSRYAFYALKGLLPRKVFLKAITKEAVAARN